MLPEDQKRILGYFIEEAKDHLNTIEQGLLNLQATIEDSEMANEVFRAAHSVKGGAAMLGLESIQHTSHRLEDYFKVLKESPIKTDRTLESMLLQIFDGLQEQLEHLQGPFGLTEDKAQEIMAAIEPVFDQVHAHLESLVQVGSVAPAAKRAPERATAVSAPSASSQAAAGPVYAETSALQLVFKSDVPAHLRTMLGLFKQADNTATRQEIQNICQQLSSIGEQFELPAWCALIDAARRVVGNEQQTFRTLAPLMIKEIKGGQDLVLAGQANRITVSLAMQDLLPPEATHSVLADESLDALLEEALSDDSAEADLTDLFATAEAEQVNPDLEMPNPDAWFEEVSQSAVGSDAGMDLVDVFDDLETNGVQASEDTAQPLPVLGTGPEVGAAELNSLADLFEGEVSELNDVWEEEEISDISLDAADDAILDADIGGDFADLMASDLGMETPAVDAEDDLVSLFGNTLLEENGIEDGNETFLAADQAVAEEFDLPSNSPASISELDDLWGESPSEFASAIDSDLDDFFDTPDLPFASQTASSADLGDFFSEDTEPANLDAADAFFEAAEPFDQVDNKSTADLDVASDLWQQNENSFDATDLGDGASFSTASATSGDVELSFDDLGFADAEADLELDDLGFDAPDDSLGGVTPDANIAEVTDLGLPQAELTGPTDAPGSLEFDDLDLGFEDLSGSSDNDFSNALGLLDLEADSGPNVADLNLEEPAAEQALNLDDESSENSSLGEFDLIFTEVEEAPRGQAELDATDFDSVLSASSNDDLGLDLGLDPSLSNDLGLGSTDESNFALDDDLTTNSPLDTADTAAVSDSDFDFDFLSDSSESQTDELELDFDSLDADLTATSGEAPLEDAFGLDLAEELDLDTSAVGLEATSETTSLNNSSDLGLEEALGLDFDLDTPAADLEAALFEEPKSELSTGDDLDFDLNFDLETSNAASTSEQVDESSSTLNFGDDLDFDLDLDATSEALGNSLGNEAEATVDSAFEDSLDFGLELDEAPDTPNSPSEPSNASDLGLGLVDALDFDLTEETNGEVDSFDLDLGSLDDLEDPLASTTESPEGSSSEPGLGLVDALDFDLAEETNGEVDSFDLDLGSLDDLEDPLTFTTESPEGSSSEPDLVLVDALDFDLAEETNDEVDSFDLDLGSLGDLEDPLASTTESPEGSAPENVDTLDFLTEVETQTLDSSATGLTGSSPAAPVADFYSELSDDLWDSTDDAEPATQSATTDLDVVDAFFDMPEVSASTESVLSDDSLTDDLADFLQEDTQAGLDVLEEAVEDAELPADENSPFDLAASRDLDLAFGDTDDWSAETEEDTETSADGNSLFDLAASRDLDLDFAGLDALEEAAEDAETPVDENLPFDLAANSDLDLDFSDIDNWSAETEAIDAESAGLDDLGDEPAASEASVTESFASSDDDLSFDELDSLLNDDEFDAAPATAEPSASVAEVTDDFADLDALLEADTADIAATSTFAAAGAGSSFRSAPADSDDEFEDLEKLLEEADQLGGSAPAMGLRRAQAAAARRAPRRTGVLADQTMRVSVKHLDNLSNLVGELVVNRNSLEQDQERLRQFLDNLLFQVQQLNDVGQRMRDLYERSLLESSLISSRQAFQTAGVSSDSSHATGVTFDALEMDRFTGFHTLSQEMIELIVRVRESSSDIAFTIESTDQITRQFRQVTTQLQEGLNKARMVPFAQTADRLPRAVRDISLKCGKEAKLVVEGRDTLIDKMILERLYDPMTHLVNNAITHGVETPEERAAAGKPREGTITVRAFYQGNQTVIYIADDGAGINAEFVKEKALKRGLITPSEARTMSKLDVYELLFLPGFSTRDQADDFAGRGVGMDVVRTALSEIRGSVTIDSEMGQGTSFTIRLPLTLSISKALSCVNNQARIAFPMDGVEDMFDAPRERVQVNDQGQSCILWRDTLLPFRPLSELLQFNRTLGRGRVYGGHQDDDIISIVVLRSANTYIALEVDQVIGEQEIVIKQLEGPVPKPTGIAGATVLGDGRVMPIADVLELIDLSMGRVRRDPSTSLWSQSEEDLPPVAETPAQAEPTVLIVDDSITVRELLSMSFNKVGYRVEQARDGQEAWEKLRSGLPCDLVFCDIEMPRMDGLELLSRMQKDSALSMVPIAMLTSRGADRHRQMAIDLGAKGYFTKPYLEEMLLDAAQRMLNGENMTGGTKSS